MRERRPTVLNPVEARQETPYSGIPVVGEEAMSRPRKPLRRPATPLADMAPGRLDATQVAEFRRRLARGYYNSPKVQLEVARRILESGDV